MNLSAFVSSISTVRSPDADTRRRGVNLITLGGGLAALCLAFIVATTIRSPQPEITALLAVAALIFLGTIYLGRIGQVAVGAWLLIVVTIAVVVGTFSLGSTSSNAPFFLVLPVLLAGVLLPPVQIWLVLALCLISLFAGQGLLPEEVRVSAGWRGAVVNGSLMLVMVALIGFVSAKGIRAALRQAQEARREAEAAGEALAASNAALEQRVEERTAALRQIAEEQRAAAAELKASLQAQHDLNRIVAELAVPVIPVSDQTLVVPLVGNIDSSRAEQILGSVLTKVETSSARTVVLDVTGVALVDTHVAGALLRVAQATRLMGARTVLAGIRPEVAQALVGLGVDLRDLHTVATLQEAL